MANQKRANPIDIHVGGRVRLRRMLLNVSQEQLGNSLGITFQQIQKYEKGTNRISASRLQQIARILSVPVSSFFEDAPGTPTEDAAMVEPKSTRHIDFLSSADGLKLNQAFVRIKDLKAPWKDHRTCACARWRGGISGLKLMSAVSTRHDEELRMDWLQQTSEKLR